MNNTFVLFLKTKTKKLKQKSFEQKSRDDFNVGR